MITFRDIKRNARRSLHEIMRTPVLYISNREYSGVPLHVRLHTKFAAIGAFQHGPEGFASANESHPKILFMRDELEAQGVLLLRTGIISVGAGEAYSLDNAEAPDDISITWNVTVLSGSELADLEVPS